MNSLSLGRCIPATTWLRAYDLTWLRGDVLAGVTLAAYLLPAALGDASLANLAPQVGLYACLFGGLKSESTPPITQPTIRRVPFRTLLQCSCRTILGR